MWTIAKKRSLNELDRNCQKYLMINNELLKKITALEVENEKLIMSNNDLKSILKDYSHKYNKLKEEHIKLKYNR